jgi:cell division control protein 6
LSGDTLTLGRKQSTIFLDELVLSGDYLPPRLLYRENELTRLLDSLSESLSGEKKLVALFGLSGAGKSTLAKAACRLFSIGLRRNRLNNGFVHISCYSARTVNALFSQILKFLSPYSTTKGLPTEQIVKSVDSKAIEQNLSFTVVLDDFHALKSDVASDFFAHFTTGKVRLRPFNFVVISHEKNITLHKKRLKLELIECAPYTAEQVAQIIADRVERAFNKGVVPQEVVERVTKLGKEGDIRFKLELLRRAGRIAEQKKADSLTLEHIEEALANMVDSHILEHLPTLEEHELLLLYSICRSIRSSKQGFAIIGEVEREYAEVCSRLSIQPRKHTQVWEYLQKLKKLEIVLTRISGKGQRGKTTVISLNGASLDSTITEVIKEIRRRGLSRSERSNTS